MVNEEMSGTRCTEDQATEKVRMGDGAGLGVSRIVMRKSHYDFDPCKYFRERSGWGRRCGTAGVRNRNAQKPLRFQSL